MVTANVLKRLKPSLIFYLMAVGPYVMAQEKMDPILEEKIKHQPEVEFLYDSSRSVLDNSVLNVTRLVGKETVKKDTWTSGEFLTIVSERTRLVVYEYLDFAKGWEKEEDTFDYNNYDHNQVVPSDTMEIEFLWNLHWSNLDNVVFDVTRLVAKGIVKKDTWNSEEILTIVSKSTRLVVDEYLDLTKGWDKEPDTFDYDNYDYDKALTIN